MARLNAMIVTDPPWPRLPVRDFQHEWELALAEASLLLDRKLVEAYARRVGRETVKMATSAVNDARALAAMGLADHVEATAICVGCKLRMAAAVNLQPIYTVGGDVVRSLALARSSIELRTPPEAWTHAPPPHLFEPRGEEP